MKASPGGSAHVLRELIIEFAKRQRLSVTEAKAGLLFANDLDKAKGSSAGLVSNLEGGGSRGTRKTEPPKGSNDAALMVESVNRNLRPHERQLLGDLIRSASSADQLATLGRGYNEKGLKIACAVGRLQSLLDSIAEIYFGAQGRAA